MPPFHLAKQQVLDFYASHKIFLILKKKY